MACKCCHRSTQEEERRRDKELQFYLLSNCNCRFKNTSLHVKLPSALLKSGKNKVLPFLFTEGELIICVSFLPEGVF